MAITAVTARGQAENGVSAAFVQVLPSAALAVGQELIVTCVSHNVDLVAGATTRHLVTDSKSHTWVKVFEYTGTSGVIDDGTTTSVWRTKVTTQIETTDNIRNTYQGQNNPAGDIAIVEATVPAGQTLAFEPAGITGFTTPTATSRTHTLSGLTSREYLFYGLLGAQGDDATKTAIANYTEHYDNTMGGGAVAVVSSHKATRVLTGTGDTWTSSSLNDLVNGAQTLTGFYEVAEGGAMIPRPTVVNFAVTRAATY